MDELEARVRCLELAAVLSPLDRNPKAIVEIATTLYTFAKASPVEETKPVIVDKSGKGKKAATPDFMS